MNFPAAPGRQTPVQRRRLLINGQRGGVPRATGNSPHDREEPTDLAVRGLDGRGGTGRWDFLQGGNKGSEMTCALYLRVSTRDQTTANQEPELRAWAERLSLEVIDIYRDVETGKVATREGLECCLADAHRARWNVLLIWAFDRLTREGPLAAHTYLRRLQASKVELKSLHDPWLATGLPMTWEILLGVVASMAKAEAERISERTKAGLARAAAAGHKGGRPRRTVDIEEVTRRRLAGWTWSEIARALSIPQGTVRRYAKNVHPELLRGIYGRSRFRKVRVNTP